jgi:hypothetical protein
MPIWGEYFARNVIELPNKVLFVKTAELIKNDTVYTYPAYTKMLQYINEIIDRRVKDIGFCMTTNLGTEELPDYIMSMVLWKKVCVFDCRSGSHNAVKDAFDLISDLAAGTQTAGPKQKTFETDADSTHSTGDVWKACRTKPPGLEVMLEHYITTREDNGLPVLLNEALQNSVVTTPEFNRLVELCISRNIEVRDLHFSLIAMCVGEYICTRSIQILNGYDNNILLMVIVHFIFKDKGFPTLANLMIAQCREKNTNTLSIGDSCIQTPVPVNNLTKIQNMFTHCGTNLVMHKLTEMIIYLNKFEWDFNYADLSIEFTTYFLLTTENKKETYGNI